MKYAILLFVMIACLVTSISGCQKNEQDDFSFDSIDPIESYDSQSIYLPEENSAENDVSIDPNSQAEGLLVKSKKYAYKENDIVILNVTNQTNTNYIVTVRGTYLDKDGKAIKNEEQSFDQFSAGYQNNFLFNPGIAFEDFTYEIQTAPTNEPMHVDNLDIQFHRLFETEAPDFSLAMQGDDTFYPIIMAEFVYQCKTDVQLHVTGYWIIINDKDEIISIEIIGAAIDSRLAYKHKTLYHTEEDELVWPENMTGEIRAVHAVCVVKPM